MIYGMVWTSFSGEYQSFFSIAAQTASDCFFISFKLNKEVTQKKQWWNMRPNQESKLCATNIKKFPHESYEFKIGNSYEFWLVGNHLVVNALTALEAAILLASLVTERLSM